MIYSITDKGRIMLNLFIQKGNYTEKIDVNCAERIS